MQSSSGSDDRRDEGQLRLGWLLSLLAALAGVAVFALLAREATQAGSMTAFDARYLATRRALATPGGQRFYATLTSLGSPVAMTILALVGAFWLGLRRQWDLCSGWATAFIGSALIVQITKRTIHHARPLGAEQFLHGSSFSFPSGHVVGSLVGFGMLAYVLSRMTDRGAVAKVSLHIVAACVVIAIAWSRLYLGVHFVSDVLGGVAIGSAWLLMCIVGTEWLCKHHADRAERVNRM